MHRITKFAVAGAVMASAGLALPVEAQPKFRPGQWEQLGCQSVGFIKDRDLINVGRKEGRFTAIRLKVSRNKVFFEEVKVVYGNGEPDVLPVKSDIRAGGQTRPLDLKGQDRFIDKVELVYRSRPSFKGQAQVCVEGRHR